MRTYSEVFWARYQELSDWEKIYKNIERGEQKIQRQQDIMNAIAAKLERYKNPWQELKVGDVRGARGNVRVGSLCVSCIALCGFWVQGC